MDRDMEELTAADIAYLFHRELGIHLRQVGLETEVLPLSTVNGDGIACVETLMRHSDFLLPMQDYANRFSMPAAVAMANHLKAKCPGGYLMVKAMKEIKPVSACCESDSLAVTVCKMWQRSDQRHDKVEGWYVIYQVCYEVQK